jgi:pre-mRNA-splicing factor ATP-dependent RNA helicase DHX15/PRP43
MEKIGILDPNGNNPNPMNENKPYSDNYKKLAKIWSKLPAYSDAENIIKIIKNNKVIIITSQTGSGKTVLVPKYVMHALDYQKKIAITLPKQIVAKSAAEYAAQTLDVILGEEVGYQYKGADVNSKSSKTKMLYATDGTIVARLMNDPSLSEFSCVIIDEAHERSVRIDFLLYLLKTTLDLRPDFKLVIMSATIDINLFKSYYYKYDAAKTLATLELSGQTNYPITRIFNDKTIGPNDYLDKGYSIMKEIMHKDNPDISGAHDILFFVASYNEANDICERIARDKLDGYCIEVYSGMKKDKEEIARDREKYKEITDKSRKLVIATPVAESSLTIDGIKYVIDSGYELFGYYDPTKDARVLEKKVITHAQARQRMGRAGRTEPGVCYFLCTQQDFDTNMARFPEPSIRVSNIYDDCLKLMADMPIDPTKTHVEQLLNILTNFIEPPREIYIRSAITQLQDLKLIENNNLSELGKIIGNMNIDPMEGMALYASKRLRVSIELMKIISILDACKHNLGELFRFPTDMIDDVPENKNQLFSLNKKFEKIKDKFKNKYGDHIAVLNIFDKFINKSTEEKRQEYTYKYFLNTNTLLKAEQNYLRIRRTLRSQLDKIPEYPEQNNYEVNDKVIASLYYGFRLHVGYLHENSYNTSKTRNVRPNKNSFIHNLAKLPNHIFYHELFNGGGKLDINIVSMLNKPIEDLANKI